MSFIQVLFTLKGHSHNARRVCDPPADVVAKKFKKKKIKFLSYLYLTAFILHHGDL